MVNVDVTMSKAQAKAAMTMHQRQGISLKEAWRRVKGGGRRVVTMAKKGAKRAGRTISYKGRGSGGSQAKAVKVFYKVGGVVGVATIANVADKVHLMTRLKNIAAHTSSIGDFTDQLVGQLTDAGADIKADVTNIIEVPALGWLAKKGANWVGFDVPKWWLGDWG